MFKNLHYETHGRVKVLTVGALYAADERSDISQEEKKSSYIYDMHMIDHTHYNILYL